MSGLDTNVIVRFLVRESLMFEKSLPTPIGP